ncbi:unnamed protein product [Cylicocyclus nassatus]|uniref:Uncharacterized protein n=1 Tax=Cylicocyclus nassatus TaxID=53992 RepID=A0AA36MDM6_CYLNA|nr:unnamed protein product [Cylicocyclus nassatus]
MRLLFCVAAITSFARCTIDERPEDKNYVDEIVEEHGFDDLTIEEEPIDREDSFEVPLLLPSPSFTPTSTAASTWQSESPLMPSVSSQLLMSPPDISFPTLPPLLQPPATSTMGPDSSVTIPPSMHFMPDHPVTNSPLVSLSDPSPQVLIPPPDELPEDVIETTPPTQSTTVMTTTSRPSYTILTVAIVPPIEGMSMSIMDTQRERANYTFDGMTTQQPAMTTMTPKPRFRTTLIDEVVTFKPPSDPPVFATLLHSMPTSTRRPRIVKLNDGERQSQSGIARCRACRKECAYPAWMESDKYTKSLKKVPSTPMLRKISSSSMLCAL